MPSVPPLWTAIAAASVAAILFFPALGLSRPWRLGALVTLLAFILLTPLIVPTDRPFGRCLAGVFALALLGKLVDLHIGANVGHRPAFLTFLLFLPNPASLVLRKLDDEPRPPWKSDLTRLILATPLTLAAAVLFAWTFFVDWSRVPFAVEHCVKVTAFFLALAPVAAAGVSAIRLLGGKARDGLDNPFASRTPADFWKRYNRPAQQFFYEDVFKSLGGRRTLFRAMFLTFAVSGILHEYLFDIAVCRVQGYQTAFFLLQGCAVALTIKVRPKGWSAIGWIVGTFAFNLATGVLFFASINEVLPFYFERDT
jgi:MBOAT membrane-bound O-acyltransferase family protein